MTDKTARHVIFVIKRFFERQKCEHQIGGSAYFENAFLSPRPDGRTDVMNGFDTLLFKITFEGNIEVRRINADKNICLQFAKTLCQIGTNKIGRASCREREKIMEEAVSEIE